jgi:RHS repeat-associated protein
MDTSYDGAGNVVQEFGPRSYAWDPLGMMTSATVGGRTFRYLYDGNNERIAAVERVPVGAELRNRTTFTLRGTGNQLLSTWTDDWTSGTRVLTRKEDTIWRGSQVLALATPLTEMNYALDHLGSPRLITSAVGGAIDQQNFDPFGEGGLFGSGALQFTGHERDRASLGGGVFNLPDYFHARFYDKAGRFLSVDPRGWDPSRPQSWNRYAYVLNNPIGKVDPDGLDTVDVVNGAVNAFTNDMSLGTAPRLDGSEDFRSGQQLGDLLALTANTAEVVGGVNGTAGSFLLDVTGIGAAIGVPAGVVSLTIAAHGALSGTIALTHLSSNVNQMNQEIKTGQAPQQVKRVDKGKIKGEQDHVHFNDKNKSALNEDGTWKHGFAKLRKATTDWLEKHGWELP